ncbi:MAG: tRNA-dihydrouridine synthase [Myxococcota bacterium]|nr:tRNA-dihydrouridine synthase [Myxococcota bacterium]
MALGRMLSAPSGSGLSAPEYRDQANHVLTTEIVDALDLLVIANGDVRSVDDAQAVLAQAGTAGLMLGRGALADPYLFGRIRGTASATPTSTQRKAELAALWQYLLDDYIDILTGDVQVLSTFGSLTRHVDDPALKRWLKGLKKARRVTQLRKALGR